MSDELYQFERAIERESAHKAVDVITELEGFIKKYSVLPSHAALTLAVWSVATYLSDSFDMFPYLAILSPVKQCGKTRLTEVLGCICLEPMFTVGISEAALFRLTDRGGHTLIFDETEGLKDKFSER